MFDGLNARVRDSRFTSLVEILIAESLSQLDRIKAALGEALREVRTSESGLSDRWSFIYFALPFCYRIFKAKEVAAGLWPATLGLAAVDDDGARN